MQFISDRQPVTPALWREDFYFNEANKYTANRAVTEEIASGYFMGQGRAGRLGWLTGVRTERTRTSSWGWVRARTGSTPAETTVVAPGRSGQAGRRRVRFQG